MEKRLSFAVVLATLTSLDANTADEIKNLKERVEVLEKNKEVGSSAPDAARPGAKNGTGLFFTAEALYWKMEQKGMTYAIKGTNNSLQNVQIDLDNGKSKKPELDWTWGSRLGAGYNLHRNGWDLFSTWFQLHASDHSKASIGQSDPQASPGQFLSPFWIAKLFPVNFPSLINTAKAHWKVDLDVLDLELGREFFIGKWLRLRPFIGARTAWINQDFNLRFFREASPTTIIYPATNNSSWHLDMDNDFWGIGARAGLNTKWLMGRGWSFYGNAAVSILDGHFHTRFKQAAQGTGRFKASVITVVTTDDLFKDKNNLHAAVVTTDLMLGLRWETVFARSKYLFAGWFGYEQHVFLEQNQFMNHQYDFILASNVIEGPSFFTNGGSLTTHGITAGFEFGF